MKAGKSNTHTSFEAISNGIRVSALPIFLTEQSSDEKGIYIWAYTITITNENNFLVQLISRHWKIVDEVGLMNEVTGDGVVGNQPILNPYETYEYTSTTYLKAPTGVMYGEYTFLNIEQAIHFKVDIPAFSLDSPYKFNMPS